MHLKSALLNCFVLGFICTMVRCNVIVSTDSTVDTTQPPSETTQPPSGTAQPTSGPSQPSSGPSQPTTDTSGYESAETLEGFLTLFANDSKPQEISYSFDNATGKAVISAAGGRLAESDDCSPRPTTVRIEVPLDNPRVRYFPLCTRIERCGGCTATPNVACVPTYVERVSYKVLKGEYPYDGAQHLMFPGYANVVIERHVTCRVQCMLNAEKCGPGKSFDSYRCSCQCLDIRRCEPPFFFDPETCRCSCGPVNCCPAGQATPCRLVVNNSTCLCDIDNRIHISTGNSNGNSSSLQVVHNVPAETTPPPATPSTTTATSSANDPCATYPCPPRTSKYLTPQGLCSCRLDRPRPPLRRN
ncbi:uncharacterized protein LOC131950049 [Physella acuta]|uniref:uncharacterized protein LOC131950049 n=1 Tax=Physella acuta TaxID=109671 RepID=UPI0027DE1551|nr:uncharacterized protein LOC131950049 [Physella acuta]